MSQKIIIQISVGNAVDMVRILEWAESEVRSKWSTEIFQILVIVIDWLNIHRSTLAARYSPYNYSASSEIRP